MAGNAREWLADPDGDGRYAAAGASWQDPTYMFDQATVEFFAPDYSSDAIGLRLVMAPQDGQ